ncbi:FAD-binding domain-containing protein [Xylariaceae sp. FL0804]|nr:FAD-binding domain-containing protein [Xylariaceae sp. FL0804]
MDSPATPVVEKLKEAGLADILLCPREEAYEDRITSYWSESARLRPWALIQPKSTEDVSRAVKALVSIDCNFAIRSGGHAYRPGSNNIEEGVTIDFGLMNSTTYDAKSRRALVLPGARWGQVYQELEKHGVMVSGARVADVGVGGYLTGGGNSHFACRTGLACDAVLNFEVVLADGSIVQANANENSDLYVALKGSSNNFGIVTRFDLHAFDHVEIWGGAVVTPLDAMDQVIDGFIDFTANIAKEPDNALMVFHTRQPSAQETTLFQILVNLDGVESPPAFERIEAIPKLHRDLKKQRMTEFLKGSQMPPANRCVWFVSTFKLDPRVFKRSVDLHDRMIQQFSDVITDGNWYSYMVWQPIPASFGSAAAQFGGDIMGLSRETKDCFMWLVMTEVPTVEIEAAVRPLAEAVLQELEQYADELGAGADWRFLNYCDASQNPLKSYGEENLKKMREVSAKYDPSGVFQYKVPGGFKLCNVK